MTDGDMRVSTLIAVVPAEEWQRLGLALLAAVLLVLVLPAAVYLLHGYWAARADHCWCGSCGVDYPDDADEEQDGEPDDLFAVADAVFDHDDPRPVNECDGGRWDSLDQSPNRGAWLDEASRQASQANGRWITGMQQRKLGEVLAVEVEQFLIAEAAERARQTRWDAVRDAGWEQGEPGE